MLQTAQYSQPQLINKKLQDEISERRKAENDAIKTREHLQNVIDSATEIIVSVDQNKRITTWNKTAEELTGYKNKDILNRSINKLTIFDSPQQMIDLIKIVYQEKRPGYSNIVILTKANAKKIIRIVGSVIKVEGKQEGGVLFIGKDITRDLEAHGKLLPGNSYFIPDKTNTSSIDLLVDMARSGCHGLFITRSNPEMIKSMHLPTTIQVLLLSQEKMKGLENVSDLNTLLMKLKQFSEKNKDVVILLDGMHYLLTHFPFEKNIETIYRINDLVAKNKSILLLRFDPALIDTKQLAIIENELHLLPGQKIEGLIIEDDVYDVLKYIYEQNQGNALVSFKKIMARFKIAYSTAAKRLEVLEEKGLIFTKRQGKLRTVYISEKGKTLLHKRTTA